MSSNRTTMQRTSDRELVITRVLSAPAAIVFDAWTQPEHLTRWWAPASRGVRVSTCEVDLRPGGTYHYVLERAPAERFGFSGTYREVSRPTRLVYTQAFEPVVGRPLPGEVLVTVSFEERDGRTTLVAHELYPSREVLDGVLETGMESGMRETFEQLERLVLSV